LLFIVGVKNAAHTLPSLGREIAVSLLIGAAAPAAVDALDPVLRLPAVVAAGSLAALIAPRSVLVVPAVVIAAVGCA
jgi:hypothetical protein